MKTRTPRLALFACVLTGAISLSACGGSSTPADTTVASAPESVAPESAPAASETTPPAADTVVEAPSSEAPSTEAPSTEAPTTEAPTTDAPSDPAGATTVAAGAAGAVTLEGALATQLTAMGDPKAAETAACIVKENPSMTVESLAGGTTPGFIRGLIKCAPDFMAAQSASGVKSTKLDEKQKVCVVKSSLLIISEQDDATFEKLMSVGNAGLPDDIKKEIAKKASAECGISEDVALEVMNEG